MCLRYISHSLLKSLPSTIYEFCIYKYLIKFRVTEFLNATKNREKMKK